MMYLAEFPEVVRTVARNYSLNPVELDWHVEAEHGWEPHDDGYDEAVLQAAECLLRDPTGGCAT